MSETTIKTKDQVLGEIRYAQRLAQRTARLYRRIQAFSTFLAILGGAGVMSAMSTRFPVWVSISGAVVAAVFGAMVIVIRPADKAAPNELDIRKYDELLARAQGLSEEQILPLLAEARKTDAPEIESLRTIAYNDVMSEMNRDDQKIRPNAYQAMMAAIA